MYGVYCFDSSNEDYLQGRANIMDDEEADVSTIQVLILYNHYNNNGETYDTLKIDGYTFELRVVTGSHFISGIKWDGTVYSRHGGSQFISWWTK